MLPVAIITTWLLLTFLLGATVGSFLNVVIGRLPKEKSILWPGSRCGACLQPIPWYHNLPIVSYLWLKGRCGKCGARFSPRYLIVEALCGLSFAGLYYAEMVVNIHNWPLGNRAWAFAYGLPPPSWWLGYIFHATLFSFLFAASVCDLDGMEIPLSLTMTGTLIGLIGAVLLPWPWPWMPAEATPRALVPAGVPGLGPFIVQPGSEWRAGSIGEGVYPWPVAGPLPEWLAPGGNFQTGLATGLAGALAGTFLARFVGFVFSAALGKEALGLGDADLLMMAGAFVGWQVVVAAFFISVFPGLLFGIIQAIFVRGGHFPFGPSLAGGVLIALLGWHWIGPYLQPVLFDAWFLMILTVAGAIMMAVLGFALRILQGGPRPEEAS